MSWSATARLRRLLSVAGPSGTRSSCLGRLGRVVVTTSVHQEPLLREMKAVMRAAFGWSIGWGLAALGLELRMGPLAGWGPQCWALAWVGAGLLLGAFLAARFRTQEPRPPNVRAALFGWRVAVAVVGALYWRSIHPPLELARPGEVNAAFTDVRPPVEVRVHHSPEVGAELAFRPITDDGFLIGAVIAGMLAGFLAAAVGESVHELATGSWPTRTTPSGASIS